MATSLLPLRGVWRTIPSRAGRARVRPAVLGVGLVVLHFALAWAPLAIVAADPVHGQPIALYAGPEGSRVVLTGSRFDANSNLLPDGLMLVDGDERRPLFSSSALNALRAGVSGPIERVRPSPAADRLAVVVRSAAARWDVYVVETASADAREVVRTPRPSLPVWSRDGTHLLVESDRMADVYRVGEQLELVSRHDLGRNRPWVSECPYETMAVFDGQRHCQTDLPTQLGGGWIGGDYAFAYGTEDGTGTLEIFHGLARTDRSSPLRADGCNTDSEHWLDGDHVALFLSCWRDDKLRTRRVLVVMTDGTAVAEAPVEDGLGLRRIVGPPRGPWLILTKAGFVEALETDGRVLWREFVTPFGRDELQFVVEGHTVSAIGHAGFLWQRDVPWKEGAR
jgi:hypothetical protein